MSLRALTPTHPPAPTHVSLSALIWGNHQSSLFGQITCWVRKNITGLSLSGSSTCLLAVQPTKQVSRPERAVLLFTLHTVLRPLLSLIPRIQGDVDRNPSLRNSPFYPKLAPVLQSKTIPLSVFFILGRESPTTHTPPPDAGSRPQFLLLILPTQAHKCLTTSSSFPLHLSSPSHDPNTSDWSDCHPAPPSPPAQGSREIC